MKLLAELKRTTGDQRATVPFTPIKGLPEWLDSCSGGAVEVPADNRFLDIEKFAARTNAKGSFPLWEGYRGIYKGCDTKSAGRPFWRKCSDVRTTSLVGRFYTSLVLQRRPMTIVEIGTAFGVSGMYWLRGLENLGRGILYTFEPNQMWRALAIENLHRVGSRFVSIGGTFEDNIDLVPLPGTGIDIAFVDAIHTPHFVYEQVDILKDRMRSGGLILLDDINFSEEMRACWDDLSRRQDIAVSAEIDGRVGMMELLANA